MHSELGGDTARTVPVAQIERAAMEFDPCALECDGMTSVLSTLLTELQVEHARMLGVVLDKATGRAVRPHWWIALPGGWVLDIRLRLWLGDSHAIPHGVFMPDEYGIEYVGAPFTASLPSRTVVDILCDYRLNTVLGNHSRFFGVGSVEAKPEL